MCTSGGPKKKKTQSFFFPPQPTLSLGLRHGRVFARPQASYSPCSVEVGGCRVELRVRSESALSRPGAAPPPGVELWSKKNFFFFSSSSKVPFHLDTDRLANVTRPRRAPAGRLQAGVRVDGSSGPSEFASSRSGWHARSGFDDTPVARPRRPVCPSGSATEPAARSDASSCSERAGGRAI